MDAESPFRMAEAGVAQAKTRAVALAPQVDLGMEVQHLKKVEVRLDVEYRISGFSEE